MSDRYHLTSVFLSIQGEGSKAGEPTVFVRFAGCNLWDGNEHHRAEAKCRICDTNFKRNFSDTLDELVDRIRNAAGHIRSVTFTGGEPLLQLDQPLVDRLRALYFKINVETNGTVSPKFRRVASIHIVCSPKTLDNLILGYCHTLKLLWPWLPTPDGRTVNPETVGIKADAHFIQPIDVTHGKGEVSASRDCWVAAQELLSNPDLAGWRLSLQTHKLMGLE